MFVSEFLFSILLLSFAALLCLSGLVLLIDGMIRITSESFKHANRKPEAPQEPEERSTSRQRAA